MKNRKYYTADLSVMGELAECLSYDMVNSCYYQVGRRRGEKKENLLNEHQFQINLNGKLYASLICTPIQLTSLVIGHLSTSGIISSLEDIEWIKYNQDNTICDVFLTDDRKSCNYTEIKTIREEPFIWEPRWIMELAEIFKHDTELHASTHGTHSCFLAKQGKVLYVCEDIGRHNALDKAVGMAMLNGILLPDCMVYISGRVPLDMLLKVIRIKIPLIASNTVPTKQSVELAREKEVILIGRVRPKRFIIYSDVRKDVEYGA